jgi:hypothetical protein
MDDKGDGHDRCGAVVGESVENAVVAGLERVTGVKVAEDEVG